MLGMANTHMQCRADLLALQACEVPCDALNNFCSLCSSLSANCATTGCGCGFFDEDCQYECSCALPHRAALCSVCRLYRTVTGLDAACHSCCGMRRLCPYCKQYCGAGKLDSVCPTTSTAPTGPTTIATLPSNLQCSDVCNLCPLGCDYYNSAHPYP